MAPKRQREGWNKTEPKQTYVCEDVGCIREVDSKAKRRIKFSVKVAVSVGYPYGWEQTNVQKQHWLLLHTVCKILILAKMRTKKSETSHLFGNDFGYYLHDLTVEKNYLITKYNRPTTKKW